MRLGLEITGRCNAACAHCSSACGPTRNEFLSTPDIFDLMDQAARIADGPLEFALTGGEPFLDRDRLRELVAHGTSLGAVVSCVTNGFWASSMTRALEILAPLAGAGLRLIGVSSSRYHQEFVPVERVRNALAAARQSGIRTVLKRALIDADLASTEDPTITEATAFADEVEHFAVVGPGRAPDAIPEQDLIRPKGIPLDRCPSEDSMVAADGRVLACCSSGPVSALHRLGDIHHETLATALDRLRTDPVHRRLRAAGPASFLPAVVRAGHGRRLREAYVDVCDLCTHLGADPVLAALIVDAAAPSTEYLDSPPTRRHLND